MSSLLSAERSVLLLQRHSKMWLNLQTKKSCNLIESNEHVKVKLKVIAELSRMSLGSFRQDDPSSAWIIHPSFQAKHNEENNPGKICIIFWSCVSYYKKKKIWTYLWHQVTWSQRQTSRKDQLDKDQRVCECWLYDRSLLDLKATDHWTSAIKMLLPG